MLENDDKTRSDKTPKPNTAEHKSKSFVSRISQKMKPSQKPNEQKVEDQQDEQSKNLEKSDTTKQLLTSLEENKKLLEENKKLLEENKKLLEENKKLKYMTQKLAADADNLGKSHAKEIQNERNYGISNFAKEMLEVFENLKRALSVKEGDISSGVQMTASIMQKSLTKHGVEHIESYGKVFDYNLHQAIKEEDSAEFRPGFVVEVLREGYKIKDRVLSPALVVVSSQESKGIKPEPISEKNTD